MTKTRIAPAAVFATVALACIGSATAGGGGTASGRWSVVISLKQTTTWNYVWDGLGFDGCSQSEHGSGSETIVLHTARAAKQRLAVDSSGHIRVGPAALGLAKGLRVRKGTFVSATQSGQESSCVSSTERKPVRGCGSRTYRPNFALAGDSAVGGFRLITRGGGTPPAPCPAPPAFAADKVAFGVARVLRGSIPLSSLRNPRTTTVTVTVAYNGESPYAGADLDRPEQVGRVTTRVSATILLKRA